ncbi:hypothetical protein O4220_05165 [Rhodococcus ruber]|uniref:Glycosyltransferase RgtA/B/C/D-like domain-containing protein n=1 Tax=Rhodococcus ruber TaxID=1830 RepID=A0ABT4MAB0_9NOCA|nr:hypothetical protein [Rhodococcus ruber]MCZ4517899.1 hypothetical protein [Rhodococcus ruber]
MLDRHRPPRVELDRVGTDRPRLTMADASVLAALAGVLSMVELPTFLRAILASVLLFCGPGVAILTWVDLPRVARLSAVPTLSIAVMTVMTTGAMWSYRWSPRRMTLLLCILMIGSSIQWYRKNGFPSRSAWLHRIRTSTGKQHVRLTVRAAFAVLNDRATLRKHLPLLLLALALVLWLPALPGLRTAQYSQFGLLVSGTGPVLVICMALTLAAFLIAIRRWQVTSAALAVAMAMAVQRLTVTLVTDVPIYEWTYKHVGVTEYILKFSALPPNGVSIYSEWPSFFVVSAWFTHITGFGTLGIAHVFAPMIHVLIAVTIYGLARVMTLNRRTAITAAMVGELVNWVGQDYYSPQAWGLVLAFGFLGLLMTSTVDRRAAYLALIPFAGCVATHQLTPYWLFGVAGVLLVTKRAKPWWLMIPLAVILLGYLFPRLAIVAPYGLFQGFDPVANAESNVQTVGVFGYKVTTLASQATFLAVYMMSGLAVLYAWRRRTTFWAPAVMAFGSIGLLGGQSYGGEAIFRVYLYATAGCAILIAPVVVDALDGRFTLARIPHAPRVRQPLLRSALVALSTLFVVATGLLSLQGYYGRWPIVQETAAQIEQTERIISAAPDGTTVITIFPAGFPTHMTADYVRLNETNSYFHISLDSIGPGYLLEFPTRDQVAELDAQARSSAEPTYIVLTRQSMETVHYYGYAADSAADRFQGWLRENSDWAVKWEDADIVVFEHDPT